MKRMTRRPAEPPVATATVEIRIAADPAQLPTLRALAETVALLADFTLDEVSDVRLAVDEAASILVPDAVPGATLSCLFAVDAAGIGVRVWTVSRVARLPDQHDFGWHVLRTLTDSVAVEQDSYDQADAGYRTTVTFSRVRGSASVR
jgi:serine/threonine-protein kinase RsbW